jgi:gliding motility-associated-like protein
VLTFLGLVSSREVQATHLRAGDIQARIDTTVGPGFNPRRVFFKMVLYQKTPGGEVPDENRVTIFFGDCTPPRVIERSSVTVINGETNRNIYLFEHTYNAPGRYTVHYIGENRNRNVLNMSDSGSQPFYISTSITIDPGLGQNSSPILTKPAIDNAAVNQVFIHNPGAYDADGDSLAYKLLASQQVIGGISGPVAPCFEVRPVTTTGFVFPNNLISGNNGVQVAYSDPPSGNPDGIPGAPAIFQQNPRTGTIIWNSPGTVGEYNVAFVVEEWRRTTVGTRVIRRLISEVIRDLQINVRGTTNQRPILTIPPDICVVAGTLVTGNVTATDPDNNPVRLEASSGILPPATFTQSSLGPPTAAGVLRWTTSCTDIATEPKLVTFTARDQPTGANPTPLVDVRTWRITVIGPAPQNLVATPREGNSVVLTWNSYACRKPGARILIFRKENRSDFNPGPCQTGIPPEAGYTQIGTLVYPALPNTTDLLSFVDNGNGQGLERGKTYCYRIYVDFPLPAGGQSIASQEACVTFPGRPVVFTNVTVDETSATNGRITVKWTKPGSTEAFNPPLVYRLLRATGQSSTATFTEVYRVTGNLNDTTYVDNGPGLDTQNRSYIYKLEFIRNATAQPGSATVVETATAASSVRVDGTADPQNNRISLQWTYNVPWNNSRRPTTIYRKNPGAATFVQIATVTGTTTGGTYVDQGTAGQPLVKGQTYCYYVSTNGTYDNPRLPDPLINLSQQQCIALQEIPCPPVLTLKRPNCDSLASRLFDLPVTPVSGTVYTNNLSWTLGNTPSDCSRIIASYNIYYSPNPNDSLRFLASVPGAQTMYQHRNLSSEAGCYAVEAVDVNGTRSARSNVECKEDCQLFLLPNIFTPNGDGINDVFRPKVFTPIRRTRFMAFNRWGVKIYESDKEPLIKWDGGSRAEGGSEGRVVEGVYYYQAEVEFGDANNTKRTYKGWVEITR